MTHLGINNYLLLGWDLTLGYLAPNPAFYFWFCHMVLSSLKQWNEYIIKEM